MKTIYLCLYMMHHHSNSLIITRSHFFQNSPLTRYDCRFKFNFVSLHYIDVIMGTVASQITSLTIVYSSVYWDADQRKYQSSASPAFVRGIHRRPVNFPHKWPVTRKMFPFDDVIMAVVEYRVILDHVIMGPTLTLHINLSLKTPARKRLNVTQPGMSDG